MAGIDTPSKRASVQAYSGGPASVVARLDNTALLSNVDRAHISEIYRGVAPGPVSSQVNAQFSVAVSQEVTISSLLSSAVQNAFVLNIAADTALQKNINASIVGDAIVSRGISAQSNLDSSVSTTRQSSVGADSATELRASAGLAVDATIYTTFSASTNADVNVTSQIPGVATVALEAAVETPVSSMLQADLAIGLAGDAPTSLDASILASRSLGSSLGAVLEATGEVVSAGADLVATAERTASASLQAAAQASPASQTALDVGLATRRSAQAPSDAVVAKSPEIATPLDAAIESLVYAQSSLDAIVQTSGILSVLDVAVQTGREAGTLIDTVTAASNINQISVDSAILGTVSGVISLNVAIKAIDITNSASLDVGVAATANPILVYNDSVVESTQAISSFFDCSIQQNNKSNDIELDVATAMLGESHADADLVLLSSRFDEVIADSAVESRDYTLGASLDTLVYNYNPFLPAPRGEYRVFGQLENSTIFNIAEDRKASRAILESSKLTIASEKRNLSGIPAEIRTVGR